MFTKRAALIIVVVVAAMLAVGGSTTHARRSELAPSATAPQRLSSEITISAFDNEQYLPSVAYNWKHKEYLVVWHNTWTIGTRDIRAQRISQTGQLLGEFTVAEHATRDQSQPSVAYDPVNDRYLVAWIYDSAGDGSDWDVYGRFIPWDGPNASLTQFSICTWTTSQWNPEVTYARAQEEFLVVWTNTYAAGTPPAYISGRRVKAADGTFPVAGFTIASHTTENRVHPDVAYNLARNEYLVTYGNGVDIYAVRLRGDGVALGGGEFGIAGWPDSEEHPAVAACSDADQYLVAWQSFTASGTNTYDLYVRFVKGDGTLDGGPLVVYNSTAHEQEPDIACAAAGQQYLVVWEQQYSNTSGPYDVWGRLVFANKTMDSASGVVAPSAGAERTDPTVAGGAPGYLTTWEHERAGTSYRDIHGRLLWPRAAFLPLALRN